MTSTEPATKGRISTLGYMLPIAQGLRQSELVELARLAESVGLDAVGIGEYASSDAFALAAAIAAATERIRIETGVISVMSRSSAMLAMGAATLADMSDGRFVLGLGAGSPVVARFHGRDFDKPLGAVSRTVNEVKTLLDGGRLADNDFELRMPIAAPVPIMLSALNPGMLRLSATATEGVYLPLLCSPRLVAELVEFIDAERLVAGRTGAFETLAIQYACATDDDGAVARFKREVSGYFMVPTYRRAAADLVGEPALDEISKVHAAGGMSAAAAWLPDTVADELFVQGGSQVLAERIRLLEQTGCDGLRFNAVTTTKGDASGARALIEALGAVERSR